jgi:ATP-dependent DNA ligase
LKKIDRINPWGVSLASVGPRYKHCFQARRCARRSRGLWRKVKCLHREEFVVVGWTDPEGSRPWLGALLLAYYDPAGRLVYAGRAGTGMKRAELERLWRKLQPLATSKMSLDLPLAPRQPFRIVSRSEPRALGAAGARRRGQISHVDRREPGAPRVNELQDLRTAGHASHAAAAGAPF